MARKSFKGGLGSLIQDSRIEQQREKEKEEVQDDKLLFKYNELNEELHLWRTGKLTIEIFTQSLKENNLKYDKKNNSFSKIK
jgi:hypothetical protein